MEKLCIDVRGFSEEKKKRVQDAFFELGYEWLRGGQEYAWLTDDDEIYHITHHNKLARGFLEDKKPNIIYPELMRKAGLDESDPDAVEKSDHDKGIEFVRERASEFSQGLASSLGQIAGSMTAQHIMEVRASNLRSAIDEYINMLEIAKDTDAREIIKQQITDLTDLQFKQLSGENNND